MLTDWIVHCNKCSHGKVLHYRLYDEHALISLECHNCHSSDITVTDQSNHVILRENDLIHAALDI